MTYRKTDYEADVAAMPKQAPPAPTTDDVLERAAQLIERDGWRIGEYGFEGYGFCAVGAIKWAIDELGESFSGQGRNLRHNAFDRMGRAIGRRGLDGQIIDWNDSLTEKLEEESLRDRLFPERTRARRRKKAQQIVIDTLRSA